MDFEEGAIIISPEGGCHDKDIVSVESGHFRRAVSFDRGNVQLVETKTGRIGFDENDDCV